VNKKIICILSILSACYFQYTNTSDECCSDLVKNCNYGKNLWQPRPFSSYGAREVLLLKDLYDHPFKHDEWDGTISIATEYMKSLQKSDGSDNLGAMPFWSETNSMIIGNNDGTADLDAYQFGMGNVSKQGAITLNPKVRQVGSDIILHFTRYKHDRGFFFKLRAPVGAMSIKSELCEAPAELENAVDQAWLMYPPVGDRYETLSQAFAGGSATESVVNTSLNKSLALNSGKISCCELTSVRLGDLTGVLGFNFFADEHYHLSLGIKTSCPTGTVPTGEFVFEPIFGRAGHWAAGLEFTAHYKHWVNEDEAKAIDIWIQSDLLHLYSGRRPSWRSFDLKKNGPGSKYMLVQFYFAGNPPTVPSGPADNGRTPSFVTQAINVTTMPVLSSFNLEGNLSTVIEYSKKNWNMSFGVDIWGRTKECLQFDHCNIANLDAANLNDFAVLGRQISEDATDPGNIEPLYYCDPCAQINKSHNRVLFGDTPPSGVKDARLYQNRIPENLYDALDVSGAIEGRVISTKVSCSGGYAWKKKKYSPAINIFVGFEMTSYDSLRLNMWSVGFNGSLNF